LALLFFALTNGPV